MTRRLLGLAFIALTACGPKEVAFEVKIIKDACLASVDPFEGVNNVWLRITADDIGDPIIATSQVSAGSIEVPEIPAGNGRVIEVRGYQGNPTSGGTVVSVGRSRPFDVPDVVPEDYGGPTNINVLLRRVNVFSPVNSVLATSSCQTLREERVGHSAVLLASGKVLISGGYRFKQGSTAKEALTTAELYNPETGTMERAQSLSGRLGDGTFFPLPAAYQAAVLHPVTGQAVLWGGEVYDNDTQAAQPQSRVLFYEESTDVYLVLQAGSPAVARSRHQVVADSNGFIVAVGGTGNGGALVNSIQWLDGNQFKELADGEGRVGATVAALQDGNKIVVAGGSDGIAPLDSVVTYQYSGGSLRSFAKIGDALTLAVPRRDAAGALLDDSRLALFGGYSDQAQEQHPLGQSPVINLNTNAITSGPALTKPRAEACAASLPNGRILVTGGRVVDTAVTTVSSSDDTVEYWDRNGAELILEPVGNLPKPVYGHTCTVLSDGSVLLAGGITEATDGSRQILNDIYLFTPAPLD